MLTSYLVSNAIVLPMSGWFSATHGPQTLLHDLRGVFTISSFLCGLAPNLGALIFFRVLQGTGRRRLATQRAGHSRRHFSAREARHGLRRLRHGRGGGAGHRAHAGRLHHRQLRWRWIFYINVPIGIISLLLTSRLISDPPYLNQERKRKFRIDYIGLGLLALGLGALQVVLDKGQRDDWFDSTSF